MCMECYLALLTLSRLMRNFEQTFGVSIMSPIFFEKIYKSRGTSPSLCFGVVCGWDGAFHKQLELENLLARYFLNISSIISCEIVVVYSDSNACNLSRRTRIYWQTFGPMCKA